MQATVNSSTEDNSSLPRSLTMRLVILAVVMLALAAVAIAVGVLVFKTGTHCFVYLSCLSFVGARCR